MGQNYDDQPLPFGFGIRHDAQGDNRYVPWFNAPPGTAQEMGLFLLLSDGTGDQALAEVARLTRDDRFAKLPGHLVFTSHYHVEHTRELLEAQERPAETAAQTGRLPSGREYRIPEPLTIPGFVRVFRDQGIDIVHLAEFPFRRDSANDDEPARRALADAACRVSTAQRRSLAAVAGRGALMSISEATGSASFRSRSIGF